VTIDEQGPDRVERVATIVPQANHEVEPSLPEPDLRFFFTHETDSHCANHVTRRQTDACRRLAVDCDLKLRQDPDCPVCGTRPSITSLREYATYCAPGVAEMTAGELRGRLGSSSAPFVLDVREPAELAEGSIPGSVMIPLGQLPQRLAELDASREIIVYCRSGARSGRAVALMRESGFSRVSNLAGGILNWNKELGKNL